jgi:hypothetical protein
LLFSMENLLRGIRDEAASQGMPGEVAGDPAAAARRPTSGALRCGVTVKD